jgi:hypothetical protein
VYEIPARIGLRYQGGVRRQLNDLNLVFTEERGLLNSRFVIRTECRDLYEALTENLPDIAAERPV